MAKEIWIINGYEICAMQGFESLKIEPLAAKTGKSKSSFYHHFADLDIFTHHLLEYHLHQAVIIAGKEKKCTKIDPEIIDILCEHRIDMLFNRQLRIYSDKPEFASTIKKSDHLIASSFLPVWLKQFEYNPHPHKLESMFQLALLHFFLQITPAQLNREWLSTYFASLHQMALDIT
jgi:AcrR family transcriptional regulator